MRERDKARRLWRRRRDDSHYAAFKRLKNQVQSQVRAAKMKYYLTTFGRIHKSSGVWACSRQLGLIKMKEDNKPLSNSVEELNLYFSQVSGGGSPSSLNPSFFPDEFNGNKFYWKYISKLDIKQLHLPPRIRWELTVSP